MRRPAEAYHAARRLSRDERLALLGVTGRKERLNLIPQWVVQMGDVCEFARTRKDAVAQFCTVVCMRAIRHVFPDIVPHLPPPPPKPPTIHLDIPTQAVLVLFVDGDPTDPSAYMIGKPTRADAVEALRNMTDALEECTDREEA